MKHNDEADIRTDTLIQILALFFVAMFVIAFTTDPIATGTKEGQRAPPLEGSIYNGTSWTKFAMDDYLDYNWTEGDNSGQWLVVEFMDTDCPYCVQAAVKVGQYANYFSKLDSSSWDGPIVNFIATSTQLNIDGHESSRAEIEAFRDRTAGHDCGPTSCDNTDIMGPAHRFGYIDDIDQDNIKKWGVPGTPFYFIIKPNGIVAWVSSEHPDEELPDAIVRVTQE